MPRTEILYDRRGPGRDYVNVDFSFAPNGSSAVAATSIKGKGIFSVSRSGAGAFLVTFSSDYVDLVCANASLQLASADDKFVIVGTYTAPTASARGTLVLTVWDVSGAAATDVSANANNRVNCSCVFRKSSITP